MIISKKDKRKKVNKKIKKRKNKSYQSTYFQ